MLDPLLTGEPTPSTNAGAAVTSAMETASPDRVTRLGPVCIVDDDDWVCDSLLAVLEAHGIDALSFSSGKELLGARRGGNVRCLIVDQHMPGMTGLDLVAALRRGGALPPTILITGRLDASVAQRARELGVLAILEKPFPAARLIELVRGASARPG